MTAGKSVKAIKLSWSCSLFAVVHSLTWPFRGPFKVDLLFPSLPLTFVIGLVLQPARCADYFEEYGSLEFSEVPCKELSGDYPLDSVDGDCILAAPKDFAGSLQDQVRDMQLRIGNVETQSSNSVDQFLVRDDGSVNEAMYSVAAHFNRTHATENS